MLTDRQFFLIAVLFYAASSVYSVFLWRKGFRRDDIVNYLMLGLAFVCHTTAIFKRGFILNQCPVYNIYEATTFFTWFIVLAYLVIGLWPRFRFLGVFVTPVLLAAGVFALMPYPFLPEPWLDPPHGPVPEFSGGLKSFHASISLLAYGGFGLACAAGLMFLTQEKNLKQRKLNAVMSLLPSISRLELAVTRLTLAGWTLLTVGLATGALYLHEKRSIYTPEGDSKIIWSAIVWLFYFVVLVAHKRRRLTGRRFALVAIGGFVFVALTFWVTNLLSPIHHR